SPLKISTWAPARGVCAVTPGVGGTKNPEKVDRYRPCSVARVHVGSCSFFSAYPGSTVRSPTVMTSPIPILHRLTRFMFVLLSYGMYKMCVRSTSRPFSRRTATSGRQDVLPLRRG